MNKQIDQISDQVMSEFRDAFDSGEYIPDEFFERFAELIVKKCAELCLTYEIADGPFGEKIYRKGKHFNVMIRNHFGVE